MSKTHPFVHSLNTLFLNSTRNATQTPYLQNKHMKKLKLSDTPLASP